MAQILLIDDDVDFSESLREQLRQLGHETHWVDCAEAGLELLASANRFDLILLDNLMPRMTGLEFLQVRKPLAGPGATAPVILMTSAATDRTVIQAMNLGAFAYVIKPVGLDEIIMKEVGPEIRRALAFTRRLPPVPIPNGKQADDDSEIVGGKPMVPVFRRIAESASPLFADEPVLILGETGTGKDLVARAIHTYSPRSNNQFIVINCTGFTETLIESELFGHERGAFTGADKLRKGRFEHAHSGTLFLDELGDMPLAVQPKLLRVLENREITRVGSNDPIKVNVRILGATHRDLKAMVREGKFREDLYRRLEGLVIHLPPLRERKEDMERLARRFLCRMFVDATAAPTLHPLTLRALQEHSWPGNVRQLQKVLRRAASLAHGGEILPEDLDFGDVDPSSASPAEPANESSARASLRQAIAWAWSSEQPDLWPLLQEMLECELLRHVSTQPALSEVQLARRLGMARNTLRARLKKYGLKEPSNGD